VVRVLGIDPGVTGAWALIEAKRDGSQRPTLLKIGDLPVKSVTMSKRVTKRLDAKKCAELFEDLTGEFDRIAIEKLSGAPGIASSTAFALGWTGATLDTILTMQGLTYRAPAPSTWKKTLRVPADKGASRRWATKLFGSDKGWPRVEDHNRAEAAMIALWGALT